MAGPAQITHLHLFKAAHSDAQTIIDPPSKPDFSISHSTKEVKTTHKLIRNAAFEAKVRERPWVSAMNIDSRMMPNGIPIFRVWKDCFLATLFQLGMNKKEVIQKRMAKNPRTG